MIAKNIFLALLAYLLPVLGWLYLWISQRKNSFVAFHLRQSVGIFLGLLLTFVAWVIVGWILAWIPYVFVISILLYALVIVVVFMAVIAWIAGVVNALRHSTAFCPFFGRWANRLLIPLFSDSAELGGQEDLSPAKNH
jgi:uncharacterized membrane protein